jgi:hypothetical protein
LPNEIHQEYGEVTDDEGCYEDNRRRSKKVKKSIAIKKKICVFLFYLNRIYIQKNIENYLEFFLIWSVYFVLHYLKIFILHLMNVRMNIYSSSNDFSFVKLEQIDQVCTFSENAALRLATTEAEEFVNYNKHFISRVTPGTWRVDSSNVNPQDFWNVGCQMGKFRD